MKYTIIVSTEALGDIPAQEVFRQTVAELDLRAVINAINKAPRAPRQKAPKSPPK